MTAPRVLVTGANGFVGEATVLKLLMQQAFQPVAALRGNSRLLGLCPVVKFDLTQPEQLPDLTGIDVVIHTAARVHVMNDIASQALESFRKVNVEGTLRLARRAASSGVKRFIFLSSIKVNGEHTSRGQRFRADDLPNPTDAYGVSKYEAEESLRALAHETGLEVVIIRPPLVYGPGVKANFQSMLRWLDTGMPLPLGAIDNKRSLVAIDNLVSLIITCVDHPSASNQVFLAGDGVDLSTSELLSLLSCSLGRPSRLIPVPQYILQWVAKLVGRRGIADRLLGSLQIDIEKNKELLGWVPSSDIDETFRRTAKYYQEHTAK
ncbi:SDR family oxidoreductase [Pseudomonas sp. SWRI99]|uniref:UDP-glucose 4-epimerase family protein n=1 Tax=Pseudomonas sp. SWRI99 TaxID=2745506 RepID=UPI0016443A96|nr:SDR family oxidoreductase [Pseudomonas sp. SWRI99]MBC3775838.1 SDR family oxidoreductase [Pseudomonas sp. SWRI99]